DYLLLTPLLALGVLSLVRFLGCDLVFAPEGHVALDPPANFVARPGNHRVDLSWDPVDNADGYRISRAEAPGPPYTTDFSIVGAQTTFTDSGLINGVAEFYVIAATQDGDASVYHSPEISATPGQGLVVSKTLGTIRNNFTGFAGMVIRI